MHRKAFLILTLVALVVGATACAKLEPGANTFLTRSEQALDVAFWTCDGLFKVEQAAQPELDTWLPGTHAKVNVLRAKAPPIFKKAMTALDLYRAQADAGIKNPDKTEVTAALAVTDALANEAGPLLATISEAQKAHAGGVK